MEIGINFDQVCSWTKSISTDPDKPFIIILGMSNGTTIELRFETTRSLETFERVHLGKFKIIKIN